MQQRKEAARALEKRKNDSENMVPYMYDDGDESYKSFDDLSQNEDDMI